MYPITDWTMEGGRGGGGDLKSAENGKRVQSKILVMEGERGDNYMDLYEQS